MRLAAAVRDQLHGRARFVPRTDPKMVTTSSNVHLRLCSWAGRLRALAATSPTTSQITGTVVACKVSGVLWPFMRCLVSLPYIAHGSNAFGNGNDVRTTPRGVISSLLASTIAHLHISQQNGLQTLRHGHVRRLGVSFGVPQSTTSPE